MSWLCRSNEECVKHPEILKKCLYFENQGLTQFNPKNDFRLDVTALERYKVCSEIIGRLNIHLQQAKEIHTQETQVRKWAEKDISSVQEADWDDCSLDLNEAPLILENRILCTEAAVGRLKLYQKKLRDDNPWMPFRML